MRIKQILTLFVLMQSLLGYAQYCTTGCNDNTYVNSGNPNTIEYDNLISTFHSSLAKENEGVFKIWGEGTASDGTTSLLNATIINSDNGYNYSGTPLKVAGGSNSNLNKPQFALLTTDGLYAWGRIGSLISTSIKSTTSFSKVSIGTHGISDASNPSYSKGLPNGVEPENVKMMFGTYKTLAIVTCNGDAWVLSTNGSKNGDGTTQGIGSNNDVWHRVKTSESGNPNLTDVVALRGTANALFALTSTGKLYTWGTGTYINSGGAANRTYATEVTLPGSITPKMIGMTTCDDTNKYQTYYLLATNGKLYAMGNNLHKQLGDGTTTTSTTWKEVTASYTIDGTTYNLGGNIAWISPNEHDDVGNAAINVLTTNKKQWAWGSNSGFMIGAEVALNEGVAISYDPIYMPGNSTAAEGLNINDNIIAVETGGHTTINVKECSNYFGYVGHKVNGSMGDGTSATSNPNTYSYKTSLLVVCGTDILAPKVINSIKICPSTTANLNFLNLEVPLSQIEWHTGNTRTSSLVTNPNAVSAGTYYAFFTDISGKCQDAFSEVTVSYLQPGDTGYDDCFVCPPDPYAAQQTWWLPYRWPSGSAVKIDFQTGTAVLNNPIAGTFGQGNITSFEGNTAVTNPITGALIFVTDGNKVFRGSDGLQATGFVGGNDSAGEAAGVIPDANGVLGRDFIIFGNASGNTAGSLRSAKYNAETNVLSGITTLLSGSAIYEALEVIPHTNGVDYWILVNTTDQKVKSYLYTKASGFNSTPVSSTDVANLSGVDPSYIAVNSFISWDPRNSGKLLIARHNKIGLANFNPSTGALGTWDVKVTQNTGNVTNDEATGYSAALSPNGRYIYYVPSYSATIRYHDTTTGNDYSIGTIGSQGAGLKVAKDGRLYIVGYDSGLYYFTTPDAPPTNNPTALLPVFYTGGRGVSLQLPNNVYWGCITCQSGTAAPVLASTNITSNPATVGDLIALLSASNKPAGTVITIHSGTPATDANKLANSTAIVAGTTYYAAFYDGLAICYSPTIEINPFPVCYNDPIIENGFKNETNTGITLLKRSGEWPMVRNSGGIALESNSLGFVPTRMTTVQLETIKSTGNAIEGMMSYDIDAKCMKIYDGTSWKCFNTPSCP